jgi:hypothetical protein
MRQSGRVAEAEIQQPAEEESEGREEGEGRGERVLQ